MQRREVVYHRMGLTKGQYFHSSFFCMAAFNLLGPLFGLPFVTGSLPHSPQMVNALSENSASALPVSQRQGSFTLGDSQRDPYAALEPKLVVHENRVAPLVM